MTKQVALVTGANRGLGRSVARQLAQHGVRTLVGSRDLERGEAVAAHLRGKGLDVTAIVIDVDIASSVADAAARVGAEHDQLDILVNNAGILPEATSASVARPLDVELAARTFDTNVLGAMRAIQCFLPLLERSPPGRIVNVSSTVGSLADQSDPDSPYYEVIVPGYQASKAALNAVTVAVAKLLRGTPIKVNSVCPGWVKTDLGGPDNREAAPLEADDAARIVVEAALFGADGPSGQFLSTSGAIPW